jgi:hypothetical protein
MQAFLLALGIILILGAIAFDFLWLSKYPWGFQALRRHPVRNLAIAAFGVAVHFVGLYLVIRSLAQLT